MNNAKAWAMVAFLLGVAVSVAANVAHTYYPSPEVLQAARKTAATWEPTLGAQLASAFYPLALLLVVELLGRVDWPASAGWVAARYGGTAVVAGVAAVVSYRHMAALLLAYGEDDLTAWTGPLAVDGLMVVASFALLALSEGNAPDDAGFPEPGSDAPAVTVTATAGEAGPLMWWPLPALPAIAPGATVDGPAATLPPENRARDDAVPAVPEIPEEVLRAAAQEFCDDLAEGRTPSIRTVKKRLSVGQDRAQKVRAHLAVLADQ